MSEEEIYQVLTASDLLVYGQIDLPAEIRLGEVRRACTESEVNRDKLEGIVRRVRHRWSENGDWLSFGVALVYCGDESFRVGLFDLAMDHYDHARLIFSLRVAESQRQNEAAAFYGLGLAHLARRERMRAIDRFVQAQSLLVEARDYWRSRKKESRATQCEDAYGRLEELLRRMEISASTSAPVIDVKVKEPGSTEAKRPGRSRNRPKKKRESSGRKWEIPAGMASPETGTFKRGGGGIHFFDIPAAWLGSQSS